MNFSSSKICLEKGSRGSECLRGLQSLLDSEGFSEEKYELLDDEYSSGEGLFLHRSVINMPEDVCKDEEMLDEEIVSVQDDSLFSLPTSQSSTASSLVSQSSQDYHRKDKDKTDKIISVSPNMNSAQRMAECALRTLIGGRQTKSQPEFKVLKPQPGQTLSQIAPALWSPGFLDVRLRNQSLK
jgi:hypothetical protein